MDDSTNTNLDGNIMTTLALPLTKGCDLEGMDGSLGVGERGPALVRDGMETLSSPSSPSSSVSSASTEDLSAYIDIIMKPVSEINSICGRPGLLPDGLYGMVKVALMNIKGDIMDMAAQLDEAEKKNARFEQQIRKMKMERKDIERKETEGKEMERMELEGKENERKETERKESERKETERKGSEKMEMKRKEIERKETERKKMEGEELERKETERKETVRKEMERKELERKEMERKKMERMEIDRKETERKETNRKERERKELERKESERMEMKRKEMERKETVKKEMERKESKRKEMEREENERKETEKMEVERKEIERKESERMEMERKKIERKETKRKETERMELERKENERKETERKEMERKEMERKEMERKELVTQLQEAKGEIARLEGVIRRMSTERKEVERRESERMEMGRKESERKETERKETERKELERKEMERMEITSISPFLLGEDFPLPPLLQRATRNFIVRNGDVWMPPVVQSPPPMVDRGCNGVETGEEAFKGRRIEDGAVSGSETEWRLVGGRRRRRDFPPSSPPDHRKDSSSMVCNADVEVVKNRMERCSPSKQHPKCRPPGQPLSPAVLITGRAEDFSYAAVLRKAREHIDLDALGIENTTVRKTANGGLLIEVLEEDSRTKVEELGTRIREVLGDSVKVSCPSGKKREVRVTGFDESVSAVEIARVFSSFGGCLSTDVRVGPIRTLNNGLGMARVQLPAVAATKLVDKKCLRLGWMMARVELAELRPLQCYRCWKYGHVQNMCRSKVDRRDACFKCGQSGHMVSKCQNMAHCVACYEKGLEASHRFGGPQCVTLVGR